MVSGEVYANLLASKKRDDPFCRTNEKGFQWIETIDWKYQTIFFENDKVK